MKNVRFLLITAKSDEPGEPAWFHELDRVLPCADEAAVVRAVKALEAENAAQEAAAATEDEDDEGTPGVDWLLYELMEHAPADGVRAVRRNLVELPNGQYQMK